MKNHCDLCTIVHVFPGTGALICCKFRVQKRCPHAQTRVTCCSCSCGDAYTVNYLELISSQFLHESLFPPAFLGSWYAAGCSCIMLLPSNSNSFDFPLNFANSNVLFNRSFPHCWSPCTSGKTVNGLTLQPFADGIQVPQSFQRYRQ